MSFPRSITQDVYFIKTKPYGQVLPWNLQRDGYSSVAIADFVALDCGQYDDRWAYIHMTPEEAVAAAKDLHASALLPSHIGRFTIARHPWDEPFQRIISASEGEN